MAEGRISASAQLAVWRVECDDGLPNLAERFREPLRAYLMRGADPGSMLRGCLENDFVAAVCNAHASDIADLPAIARFIYNCIPGVAWGSRERREAWERQGGAEGKCEAHG